jgi:histidinol-phosphate aminotransferase
LRQALEEYTGLSQEHIVCGSGSDELIDLVLRLFLEPGDRVINCPPTFGMYPFSTNVCGGKIIDIPRREENFAVDIAGIKRALDGKTKVIFIASPNNPTGNTITEQEITELLDTRKIVVVDEAYSEFSNLTLANIVTGHSNLIVLRTFSKWAGLAGLRIGYGVFPTEIADYLMKIKQPYNVNSAAQVAALTSLLDINYLRNNVAKIVAERERLFTKLKELDWLSPYPSRGNFIFCSVLKESAKEIWRQLQRKGIFVRYFDSPRLKDCLRISVGKPEDTDVLIGALKEVK